MNLRTLGTSLATLTMAVTPLVIAAPAAEAATTWKATQMDHKPKGTLTGARFASQSTGWNAYGPHGIRIRQFNIDTRNGTCPYTEGPPLRDQGLLKTQDGRGAFGRLTIVAQAVGGGPISTYTYRPSPCHRVMHPDWTFRARKVRIDWVTEVRMDQEKNWLASGHYCIERGHGGKVPC